MPLERTRVDQLPLPSLTWYAGFSGLALFYVMVYALMSPDGPLKTLDSEIWCTAVLLNMSCCCLFLWTKFIYSLVFGKLQLVERQHMRDKFWNFVFYKFIFVFGVMNVQEMWELMCWCAWFAILGTFQLTEQLCKDRFQFLSYSPNTPATSYAKIIILLVLILLTCAGLFQVCAIIGWQYGFNHFTFLYSEVFILFTRTMHTHVKQLIHLWDMHHDGTWESRSNYPYYIELTLELASLVVDFMHHVHMLLWANMFLSVASLILLMKLRFLYQELQRRVKRHANYVLVNETLDRRFILVPKEELMMSDEMCAICWERMITARKLPCGHIFHMGCLRSWLEQDAVCPTCRRSLSEDLRRGRGDVDEEEEEGQRVGRWGRLRQRARRHRNWLLHFNGASIASWLPNFSLELHQEGENGIGNDAAELHRGANHIHSMFPHIPLHAITLDLADSRSVSLTVERILNNTIYIPSQEEGATPPSTPSEHSNLPLPSPARGHTHLQSLATPTDEARSTRTPSSSQRPSSSSNDVNSRTLNSAPHPRLHDAPSNSPEASAQEVDSVPETPTVQGSLLPNPESSNGLRRRTQAGRCTEEPESVTKASSIPPSDDVASPNSIPDLRPSEPQSDLSSDSGSSSGSFVATSPTNDQPATDHYETACALFIRRGGASYSTPLTNPASPYSFFALQRRKQALVENAKRKYLLKAES